MEYDVENEAERRQALQRSMRNMMQCAENMD